MTADRLESCEDCQGANISPLAFFVPCYTEGCICATRLTDSSGNEMISLLTDDEKKGHAGDNPRSCFWAFLFAGRKNTPSDGLFLTDLKNVDPYSFSACSLRPLFCSTWTWCSKFNCIIYLFFCCHSSLRYCFLFGRVSFL